MFGALYSLLSVQEIFTRLDEKRSLEREREILYDVVVIIKE